VEAGRLRHPGAFTIGSQLLDGGLSVPWLANPGNPALNPHTEGRKTGTCHTDKKVERKGGAREGKQPLRRVPMLKKTLTLRETLT